jgi:hypothetical protein
VTSWRRRAARLDDEDGVGLVSSLAGLFVFLAFLLFAAQILVHLFTTSYVNAAAFDAARLASASGDVSPTAAAEHGKRVLGPFGSRSTFEVTPSAEQVTVRVRGQSPALLPRMFGRIAGVNSIDRTVILRRERPVCDGC